MNIQFKNAKILKTNDDHSLEIVDGELWVEGNIITHIGSSEEGAKKVGSEVVWERTYDCGGNLLIPGLKDAHSHTAMTFLRSYADDVPLDEWLFQKIFPREDQMTPDDLYWFDIVGIMEYLTSGITTNFDMYYFPPVNGQASQDCGYRTVQTSGFNNFGSTLQDLDTNYNKVNAIGDLQTFIIGFHAEYTTEMERMEGVAGLVEKYKSPCFMHNSETEKEVRECIERWGKTPTELTESLGMYKYGGGGYHCVWFSDNDFEIFKKHGMTAVTCPASNLKLASGIAPVKRFIDEGINLAIGTDGAASNNALDMWREMYLTSTLSKVREMDPASIKAEEILYAATAGGAKAMNLPDCDRLGVGKKADIALIDMQQPNMQPENNIVKNLVYACGKQNVKLTMVNGKILYEDGRFDIGFDPKEVYEKTTAIVRRMK